MQNFIFSEIGFETEGKIKLFSDKAKEPISRALSQQDMPKEGLQIGKLY